MNKFLTKVAKIFLGLSMAAGIGVAVSAGKKDSSPVNAATSNGSASFNGGTPTGWTGSGTGKYPNSGTQTAVKFDSASDSIINTSLFSGDVSTGMTALSVTASQYVNGTDSNSNVITVYAVDKNGSVLKDGSKNELKAAKTEKIGGTSANPKSQTFSISSSYLAGCAGFKYVFTTKSSGNIGLKSFTWTATYTVATKTLDSISIDTNNVQKVFTTGDTFNSTGLVTTAHYTIPASFPDATVTPTSISSPNMSTAGQKTITVSYKEGDITKTATYTITVNDPRSVTGLTVYDDELNELVDEDEVTLTASSGTSIYTDVICEVTYNPTATDSNVTITSATGTGFSVSDLGNSVFRLTFSANGNHTITFEAAEDDSFAITVTYVVSGLPNISYKTDTITLSSTGVSGTSYDDMTPFSGDESDAEYDGQCAGGNDAIQIRTKNNDSGLITTSSGGKVVSITITFNTNTQSGNKASIYAKNTAYSDDTDLFNGSLQGDHITDLEYVTGTETVDYTFEDDYTFIGIRSYNNALYLDEIVIVWAVEQEIIDTLESIYIDGSLTTSTYVEGQTISLDGLTVYGHYTTAGNVSLMGKSGLTFGSSPATAISTSLDEITVNASYEGKNASETYTVSVSADSVSALGWGTRGYESGDYFLSGQTLSQMIDTSKWTFSVTWASGLDKGTPSFGTGANDVHVGLYTSPTPASETATPLTNSYTFTTADDGKYLVAFYKGTHSGSNRQLFITESLNSIVKPAEGDPGYFLVKDASNLSAGDTVVIAAFNYDYAMSATQSSNNRAGVAITKDSTDSSATISNEVQTFTLEEGTTSGTWAFNTGSGYIYAASSSNNHLKTETNKSANSSFTLTVENTGSAGLVANGTYSHKTMSWNNSSSIFSCYSSLQSNGQLAIYKYTEPMDEPINNLDLKVQHIVVEYAKSFNSTLEEVCVAYGSTDPDELSEAWSALDTKFNNWFIGSTKSLEAEEKVFAKSLFANAKYTERESANNDSLQAMLGKYDEILSRYELDDFLKDDSGRAAAPQKARPIMMNIIGENTNTIAIIVIISMVSVTLVGGYFFLRKRKENI